MLKTKGYTVKPVNPDWKKPLSKQSFRVPKNALVIGFSFGAIIAYLIAEKYTFTKAILASLSPLNTYPKKTIIKYFSKEIGQKKAIVYATDLKKIKISLKNLSTPTITLAGELEKGMSADFLVPKTNHMMTKTYINAIAKLV